MRYHLRASESEAEVNLSTKPTPQPSSGTQQLLATILTPDQDWEEELLVSSGLVQVKQADGSWKRLRYLEDTVSSGTTSFFHEGRPRIVESVGGVGGSVEGNQSEGVVCAPMNGQVVKMVAKTGDCLESGDIVLILEAMKMENEVTAPIKGTLSELSVTAGQTVSPGQTLFRIEAVE